MSNILPFEPKPREKYLIGGRVDAVKIKLRVRGDDLDPDSLSTLLGIDYDYGCQKGDVRALSNNKGIKEPTGKWILNGRCPEHYTIEDQVRGLLARVTDDLEVWQAIAEHYKVDIFCGVMMGGFNEHFVLSSEISEELAKRNLKLHIDLFSSLD